MTLPCTIDRFACNANAVLPLYNSYFYEPTSYGIDAFAQIDYGDHVNFMHPPLSVMGRVTLFIES